MPEAASAAGAGVSAQRTSLWASAMPEVQIRGCDCTSETTGFQTLSCDAKELLLYGLTARSAGLTSWNLQSLQYCLWCCRGAVSLCTLPRALTSSLCQGCETSGPAMSALPAMSASQQKTSSTAELELHLLVGSLVDNNCCRYGFDGND